MKRILCVTLSCILVVVFLAGCQPSVSDETRNLEKLAQVWGFAKYTHQAFLTGERCWDEELLNLIPVVRAARPRDINGILYDWFISLGEDGFNLMPGYDMDVQIYLEELAATIASWETIDDAIHEEHGRLDFLIELREFYALVSTLEEDNYDLDFQSFYALVEKLTEERFPLIAATGNTPTANGDQRLVVDLSWINDRYLGPLAAHLLRFDGITVRDRSNAPVSFNPGGVPIFTNQSLHNRMDFSDPGYRLLGLFRLWNAMNYYYPHLEILDVSWNDTLVTYIPMMLGGTDRHSYELTLAAMSHHLRDSAHLGFRGATFFADKFGQYLAPVHIIEAEGRLVVHGFSANRNNPFMAGDSIQSVNGRNIDEITAEMLRYLPYPNEEKALAFLALYQPMRSHTRNMEIGVIRGGTPMVLSITRNTPWTSVPQLTQSHVLLDNNIGLINPGMQSPGTVRSAMTEFAETDGIIIDLRQYPSCFEFYLDMRQYLMEEPLPFAYISRPSQTHPGTRVNELVNQFIPRCPYAYIYDKPVVLLMNETTISHPEWAIMAYRVAPNVTVMGPWSMGSNGNLTTIPLPGGITMSFTSFGVYTPESEQTHRIGLTPDIRVSRTIQGIAEGRDEIMEAAIQFIERTS
jgi:C-terminal processing protease CtpA/Prc